MLFFSMSSFFSRIRFFTCSAAFVLSSSERFSEAISFSASARRARIRSDCVTKSSRG